VPFFVSLRSLVKQTYDDEVRMKKGWHGCQP